MKKFLMVVLALAFLTVVGCAKLSDDIAANGSLLGSTKAPYIVVNESGGEIMDVYKLKNAIVQSQTAGWLFLDNEGLPVFLGGDVKMIRLKSTDSPLWDSYNEYHAEMESLTYREKFLSGHGITD